MKIVPQIIPAKEITPGMLIASPFKKEEQFGLPTINFFEVERITKGENADERGDAVYTTVVLHLTGGCRRDIDPGSYVLVGVKESE